MPIILPGVEEGGDDTLPTVTDYASLKGSIAGWLHRSDLTDNIPEFVQMGENRIYRDLRVRQMEAALSATISAGVIAAPTGYLEMKFAYVNASPVQRLERKDAEWIYRNYPTRSAEGIPKFFAREAGNFIFGPYPDSAYTVSGLYYRRLEALSGTNTTNWLIEDVPDMLIFASLCEAAPWMRNDERIAVWEQKYKQIKDRVQTNDEQEEFSGSPISVTRG